jgi:endonuclease/exonuclease/phosphatase family metal-dependent hydrolase
VVVRAPGQVLGDRLDRRVRGTDFVILQEVDGVMVQALEAEALGLDDWREHG